MNKSSSFGLLQNTPGIGLLNNIVAQAGGGTGGGTPPPTAYSIAGTAAWFDTFTPNQYNPGTGVWLDKSGNGNNTSTQYRSIPGYASNVVNGLGALDTSNTANNNYSLQANGPTGSSTIEFTLCCKSTTPGTNDWLTTINNTPTGSTGAGAYSNNRTIYMADGTNAGTFALTKTTTSFSDWNVISLVFDKTQPSGSIVSVYFNGVLQPNAIGDTDPKDYSGYYGACYVAGDYSDGSNCFHGYIVAWGYIYRKYTTAERSQVVNYIRYYTGV